jgi:hypothetical protein
LTLGVPGGLALGQLGGCVLFAVGPGRVYLPIGLVGPFGLRAGQGGFAFRCRRGARFGQRLRELSFVLLDESRLVLLEACLGFLPRCVGGIADPLFSFPAPALLGLREQLAAARLGLGPLFGQRAIERGAPVGLQVRELALGFRFLIGADLREAGFGPFLPLRLRFDQTLTDLPRGLRLNFGDARFRLRVPRLLELMDEMLELGTPTGLFLGELLFLRLLLLFGRCTAPIDLRRAPFGFRAGELFLALGPPGGLELGHPLGLLRLPN